MLDSPRPALRGIVAMGAEGARWPPRSSKPCGRRRTRRRWVRLPCALAFNCVHFANMYCNIEEAPQDLSGGSLRFNQLAVAPTESPQETLTLRFPAVQTLSISVQT